MAIVSSEPITLQGKPYEGASAESAKLAEVMDGQQIDPEALARAEAIRVARNRTFSEIEALLDNSPKQGKPKRS